MLPSVFYRDLEKVPNLFGTSLLNDLLEERQKTSFIPAVDIGETEEAFIVKAVLPGVKVEDIDIKLEKNKLVIETKKVESQKESKENWIRKEIHSGHYHRTFTLPDFIKRDAVEAKLDEGVLTLTLPKGEAYQPQKINISS